MLQGYDIVLDKERMRLKAKPILRNADRIALPRRQEETSRKVRNRRTASDVIWIQEFIRIRVYRTWMAEVTNASGVMYKRCSKCLVISSYFE